MLSFLALTVAVRTYGAESRINVTARGVTTVDECVAGFSGKLLGVINYVGGEKRTNSIVLLTGTVTLGPKLGSTP